MKRGRARREKGVSFVGTHTQKHKEEAISNKKKKTAGQRKRVLEMAEREEGKKKKNGTYE